MVVHTNPDELNLLAMMLAQEKYEVFQALVRRKQPIWRNARIPIWW